MSVTTSYDEKRDCLRKKLNECANDARELLDEAIWGYTDMESGYAMQLYTAIKQVRDMV